MNLSGLLPLIRSLPAYAALREALGDSASEPLALQLPRSARPPLIAALARDHFAAAGAVNPGDRARRAFLVVAARHDRALSLVEELPAWWPDAPLLHFAEPTPLFYEPAAWGPRTVRARLSVLAALAAQSRSGAGDPSGPPALIVASARALMTLTLPVREFLAACRPLRRGAQVRLEKLLEAWVVAGYQPTSIVVEPGQFTRRGGIVDVFPPSEPDPVRIELFGDEIESLRRFEAASQRSGEAIDSVIVTPAREGLPKYWKDEWRALSGEQDEHAPLASLEFLLPLLYPQPASLFDYLPAEALVLVDDWEELADTVSELETQAMEMRAEQVEAGLLPADFPLAYHTWADLQDELSTRRVVHLGAPGADEVRTISLGRAFSPGPRYGGQVRPLLDHLADLRRSNDRTVVVTRQAPRLAELWSEANAYLAPVASIVEPPAAGTLQFVQGALAEGWTLSHYPLSTFSLHLLTDGEIFGWSRPQPRRRRRSAATAPEFEFADLAPGDYVVHVDYGIGRFGGLVRRTVEGIEREYLLVEYDGGDQIYVPIHQAERLSRYVGADDRTPALARLGTQEWTRVRERAQQAVYEVARELLELYALREAARGRAFSRDAPWQRELEASFPYVETEDQMRAIAEVKRDMESPRPMDRLICGDVGYGKTEVALRAAFKAVLDGAQVAVLVPTTVLAQQHFNTFSQRLAPFPVKVEMLSRFRHSGEQRDIVGKLSQGEIDIVIGTHRLIQKDVRFKNLGLLVIDEEQRFGVTHKERLKRLRTEVDVLTLTATPIPRTLYLSLTGVRDISTINTAPDERLPVVTQVGPYSERLARQAILRELDRGGQVFFVHNRVQTIGVIQQKLERLAPEARIAVAHGQMDEDRLARVMTEFAAGEIDILLCTSIIESGLDIPNANTLIVDRADTFGLAQLYQLRGRVGRGAQRAYAYFFHSPRRRMTPEARQRLETIHEQTELGAGYGIAMRDLEIRGAGDILGVRQHGHIAAVGFHLYTRLLRRAVQQLRSRQSAVVSRQSSGVSRQSAVVSRQSSGVSRQPSAAGGQPLDAGAALEIGSPTIDVGSLEFEVGSLELGVGSLDFEVGSLKFEAGPLDLELVSVDLPLPALIPADYVPDRALRLQLYRRMAELETEARIEEMRAELADRFGPLPEPVDSLLYQLTVKLLARRAGVEAVASEQGQIVLRSRLWEDEDIRAAIAAHLPPGARLSKKQIWLGRTADRSEWKERLVEVLERVAHSLRAHGESAPVL